MNQEEITGRMAFPQPASKTRTAAACVSALILPGLGHIVLGKIGRGAIIGSVIITMFVLGFVMQGHLFKPEEGEWLTWFFSFLDTGIGLPYFICLALDYGFQVQPEQAARVTFEYGNTFFERRGRAQYAGRYGCLRHRYREEG
ncbi:MAG: hypothetical protein IPM55_08625 [Acidobacteria bacterium]|nr:hypothetical protein [Acidobacteriota bacterium]